MYPWIGDGLTQHQRAYQRNGVRKRKEKGDVLDNGRKLGERKEYP